VARLRFPSAPHRGIRWPSREDHLVTRPLFRRPSFDPEGSTTIRARLRSDLRQPLLRPRAWAGSRLLPRSCCGAPPRRARLPPARRARRHGAGGSGS
jgi:hypothetical protein